MSNYTINLALSDALVLIDRGKLANAAEALREELTQKIESGTSPTTLRAAREALRHIEDGHTMEAVTCMDDALDAAGEGN